MKTAEARCRAQTRPTTGKSKKRSTSNGLDVIAPGASILLVEANLRPTPISSYMAVNYARSVPGVVAVSMSFGRSELFTDPFKQFLFHDTERTQWSDIHCIHG